MAYNVTIMPVKVIGGDWDIIFANPFRHRRHGRARDPLRRATTARRS